MSAARLSLEFAPGVRPVSWLGRALLTGTALALCAALALGWTAWTARQQAFDALGELRPQQRVGANELKARGAKSDPALEANEKSAQAVSKTLMTPWSRLLESLGAAPNQAVALLSMEPSVAKRSVRLTAEARTWEDMLVYLAALQHDARLSTVVLVSHQLQEKAPGTPIRFVVQAEWGVDLR